MWGDDSKDVNKPKEKVIVPKHEDSSDKRPRLPGINYILCWISPTEIEVEVPEGVEYVDVELSSGDALVWTATVTEEDKRASLPGLYGEYILTCTTDGNHTFVATVNL